MGAESSKLDAAADAADGSPSTVERHHAPRPYLPSVPPIYRHIRREDWDVVVSHVRADPASASARLNDVRLYDRYRCNVTPLHLAVALGAPAGVVEELLEACPDAARVQVVTTHRTKRRPDSALLGGGGGGGGVAGRRRSSMSAQGPTRRRGSLAFNVASFFASLAGPGVVGGGRENGFENSASNTTAMSSLAAVPISSDEDDELLKPISAAEAQLHFRRTFWSTSDEAPHVAKEDDHLKCKNAAGGGGSGCSVVGSVGGASSSSSSGRLTPRKPQRLPPSGYPPSPLHGKGDREVTPSGSYHSRTHDAAADHHHQSAHCAGGKLGRAFLHSNSCPPNFATAAAAAAAGSLVPRPMDRNAASVSLPTSSAASVSASVSHTVSASSASASASASLGPSSFPSRRPYLRSTLSFRSSRALEGGIKRASADPASSDWLPLHVAVLCRSSPAVVRALLLRHPWGAKIKNGMGMLPIHMVCADMDSPPYPFRRGGGGGEAGAGGGKEDRAATATATATKEPCRWSKGDMAEVVTLLLRAFPESIHVCSSNADGMTPIQYAEENLPPESKTRRDVVSYLKMDILSMFPPIEPEQKMLMVHSFMGRPSAKDRRRRLSLSGMSSGSKFKSDEVPKLYALVSAGKWKASMRRVAKRPEEASIWTMLEGGFGGGSVGGAMSASAAVSGGAGSAGADAEKKMEDPVHRLPLHKALSLSPPVDVVDALIGAYPESLAARQEYGLLPLHSACHYAASYDVVDSILKAYPQAAKIRDTFGNLPLHIACARAAPMCVVRLLVGVYPEAVKVRDGRGLTPIDRCRSSGHPDLESIVSLCDYTTGSSSNPPPLMDCVDRLSHEKSMLPLMA